MGNVAAVYYVHYLTIVCAGVSLQLSCQVPNTTLYKQLQCSLVAPMHLCFVDASIFIHSRCCRCAVFGTVNEWSTSHVTRHDNRMTMLAIRRVTAARHAHMKQAIQQQVPYSRRTSSATVSTAGRSCSTSLAPSITLASIPPWLANKSREQYAFGHSYHG